MPLPYSSVLSKLPHKLRFKIPWMMGGGQLFYAFLRHILFTH